MASTTPSVRKVAHPYAPRRMGAPTLSGVRATMENDSPLRRTEPLAALSIEFVAKPDEVHRLGSTIPAKVQKGLERAPGFAGCLVMISDREARLVSVTTFWTGEDGMTDRSKRTLWLDKLLTPYVDHCLRVRTLDAYATALGSGWGGVVERESSPQIKTCSKEEASLCVA